MVQYWGKIKITNGGSINPFVAVVFTQDAVKEMQKTGMTGEVTEVDVSMEVESGRLCAVITTVDAGGMERKHTYITAGRYML